jgi:hypothetical protein
VNLESFRQSLAAEEPPPLACNALQALWWDAKGNWPRAHACAQADEGITGSIVHAYLHRKEGDLSNAEYWYRRAGRDRVTVPLSEEWDALVRELIGKEAAARMPPS